MVIAWWSQVTQKYPTVRLTIALARRNHELFAPNFPPPLENCQQRQTLRVRHDTMLNLAA
jgi:hypothetical protein